MTADAQLTLDLDQPPDLELSFHDWITQLHNQQVTTRTDDQEEE